MKRKLFNERFSTRYVAIRSFPNQRIEQELVIIIIFYFRKKNTNNEDH